MSKNIKVSSKPQLSFDQKVARLEMWYEFQSNYIDRDELQLQRKRKLSKLYSRRNKIKNIASEIMKLRK